MNKLIFISDNLVQIEKVRKFAKNQHYSIETYSKEAWKKKQQNAHKKGLEKSTSSGSKLTVLKLPKSANNLQTMGDIKVEAMKLALLKARGNASEAADALQIGRATIYRKIRELKIDLESMRKEINEEELIAKGKYLKKTA